MYIHIHTPVNTKTLNKLQKRARQIKESSEAHIEKRRAVGTLPIQFLYLEMYLSEKIVAIFHVVLLKLFPLNLYYTVIML